jgi:hypothetical protein
VELAESVGVAVDPLSVPVAVPVPVSVEVF